MNNPYVKRKWTAGSALARAKTILWDEGPRALFFKLAGELCYRRLLIAELRLSEVDPAWTFGDHDLVKPGFEEYLEFRNDLTQSEIEERLRRGHECFAILIDGKVAQAAWVASGATADIGYLGCEIELAAGDVYVYEFFVHPSYRRRKLFPAALIRLVAEYSRRGYERIIWAWMPENTRAIAVARHWPFRPLGTLGYWKVAGWRKYFTSIHAPRIAGARMMRWHRYVRRR